MRRDPYRVLGIPPTASAEELHDAYRRLIKLHHPDRNGGSAESTARFQEIQAAYEDVRNRPRAASAARASTESVEERMAKLEGEVRSAHAEREKAREAARKALRDLEPEPSEPSRSPRRRTASARSSSTSSTRSASAWRARAATPRSAASAI